MAELHIHVLTVRGHRIRCADPVMVAGGFGHDAVALDLDADWAGLSCVVTLGEGDGAWIAAVGADPVEVPASAIAEPGWLPVSVTGYGDDGAVRATTEACAHLLRVAESGYVPSDADVPDAPDLLGQLVAAAERAESSADDADEAASKASLAADGANEAAERAGKAADLAEDATEAANEAAEDARNAAQAAGEKSLYAYADPDNDELIILEYPAFLESDDGGSVYLTLEGSDN